MALILLAFSVFGWLIVWVASRVTRAIIADTAKFQLLYEHIQSSIAAHGVDVSTLWMITSMSLDPARGADIRVTPQQYHELFRFIAWFMFCSPFGSEGV